MEGHHKRIRDALVAIRQDSDTLTHDALFAIALMARELHEQVNVLYKQTRPCPGRYWRTAEVQSAIEAWNDSDQRKRKRINSSTECGKTKDSATSSEANLCAGPACPEPQLVCHSCGQCYRSDVSKGFVERRK